jgi:arsenite methyltransferase
METVTKTPSLTNRPGGFIITDRAISCCSFQPEAKILDIGCGSGATVNHLIQSYGFEAYGIDKNLEPTYVQDNLTRASAEAIPYPSTSMDGVIMECSFSMMENPEFVLKECNRVLKTDGRLIVSDMYARGDPAQLKGCLGRIDTKEDIISRIESNDFIVELFEDFSHDLQTMWGQMIFEKGAKSFYCSLGVNTETLKHIKCGYYLIVAVKKANK